MHRNPCPDCFMCGNRRNRRGRVRIWLMAGYRSILRFKPLERFHLAGTHSLSGAKFIASKIVALAHFLLDCAFYIRECVLRIAPARPTQYVLKEAQPVAFRGKPGFIECSPVVIRVMR